MIIHKEFVWIHLPKANGTVTHDHICKYIPKEDILEKLLINNPNKHFCYDEILKKFPGYNIENKKIIINFRKLPRWIISYNIHVMRAKRALNNNNIMQKVIQKSNLGLIFVNPVDLKKECDIKKLYNQDRFWLPADIYISKYISSKKPDFYIRQEFFDKDFANIFCRYSSHDFVKQPLSTSIKRTNNPAKYITINKNSISTIYKNNPKWAEIESSIYSKE